MANLPLYGIRVEWLAQTEERAEHQRLFNFHLAPQIWGCLSSPVSYFPKPNFGAQKPKSEKIMVSAHSHFKQQQHQPNNSTEISEKK